MNIEAYWGLKEKPFLNTPDTKYLYESEDFVEAMGRILFNLKEVKGGLTMIIGEVGCGKTLMLHSLIEKLPVSRFRPVKLIHPKSSPTQLLRTVVQGLGFEDPPRYRSKLMEILQRQLVENDKNSITPVLLIDEAQAIPKRVLEQIRLLLNFEDKKKKLIQIVLLGQPELKKRIKDIEQLNQRVNIRYVLKGLRPEETEKYIRHRLKVAQAKRKIFDPAAIQLIHKFSRGIPRLINTLATNSMYAGLILKKEIIDEPVINEVYEEMIQ